MLISFVLAVSLAIVDACIYRRCVRLRVEGRGVHDVLEAPLGDN